MPDEVSQVVTTEGLTALADVALASKSQSRLDELLTKNVEDKLGREKIKELDFLLTRAYKLNLVKARATAALHRIKRRRCIDRLQSCRVQATCSCPLRRTHQAPSQ